MAKSKVKKTVLDPLPSILVDKVRKQSISSIDTYDRCPALYKAKYIDNLKMPPNGAMVYGRTVHEAVEALHKIAAGNPSQLSNEEVEKVLSNLVTEQKDLKAADITRLHTGLHKYAESLVEVQNILMFEELLEFKLEGGDVFVFKPDRIDLLGDNSLRLVELKSGSVIPTREDIENNFQIQVYMLGIRKLLPDIVKYPRIYGSYYSFGKGGYVSVEANEAAFPMLEKYLENKVAQMKADKVFKTRVNSNCVMCPISAKCEAFRNNLSNSFAPEAVEAITAGDPDKLGALYSKLKSLAQIQKDNLEVVKDKIEAMVEAGQGELQTVEGIFSISVMKRGAYTVNESEYSTLKLTKFKGGKNGK
jgi:PD-(D/E)XK nuclease superfamily